MSAVRSRPCPMAFSLENKHSATFVRFQFWSLYLTENRCNSGLFHERGTIMPKLKNRPPQYRQAGKYACVYIGGKRIYLAGDYGSPESRAAYARLLAELQANPTGMPLPNGDRKVTVSELAAEFLDHAKNSSIPLITLTTRLPSLTSLKNSTAISFQSMTSSPDA